MIINITAAVDSININQNWMVEDSFYQLICSISGLNTKYCGLDTTEYIFYIDIEKENLCKKLMNLVNKTRVTAKKNKGEYEPVFIDIKADLSFKNGDYVMDLIDFEI